jgi:hypothetical protein
MATEKTDVVIVIVAAELSKTGSLACSKLVETVMGRCGGSASMAMRWTAAAMQEAAKAFRRSKARKQLPGSRSVLEAQQNTNSRGVLAWGGGRHFRNRDQAGAEPLSSGYRGRRQANVA